MRKYGIAVISTAPQCLQFPKCLETVDISRLSELFSRIAELQTLFRVSSRTLASIRY